MLWWRGRESDEASPTAPLCSHAMSAVVCFRLPGSAYFMYGGSNRLIASWAGVARFACLTGAASRTAVVGSVRTCTWACPGSDHTPLSHQLAAEEGEGRRWMRFGAMHACSAGFRRASQRPTGGGVLSNCFHSCVAVPVPATRPPPTLRLVDCSGIYVRGSV